MRDGKVGVRPEVASAARDDPGTQRAEEHRHVGALHRREPLDVRVDQVGEPVHRLGATGRPERRPRRKGSGRRGERQVGLALAPPRDLGKRLRVDRAQVGERPVASDPLAADEVLGRDLDACDLDPAHAPSSRTVSRSSTV